ncbi:hypothetical protein ATM97_15275 [Nocardia sp. MH4]|nr:hypothetical protein [Nocardia sp. MH4]
MRAAEEVEEPNLRARGVRERCVRRAIACDERTPVGGGAVGDAELAGLGAAARRVLVAVDQLVQQLGAQAADPGRDGAAFRLVGVERGRVARQRRRQFPAEVVGVLDPGIEA